jgi:hypothetical protein
VKRVANQKRRVMSRRSAFSSTASAPARGSRAMPQMGQLPGAPRTISGCMGQVHSVFATGTAGATGSRAMPHLGQLPGPGERISGCMGHV